MISGLIFYLLGILTGVCFSALFLFIFKRYFDYEDSDDVIIEKRLPGFHQPSATTTSDGDAKQGTQKRQSIEVHEPPVILDVGDERFPVQRKATDSDMEKMCESASVDDNNSNLASGSEMSEQKVHDCSATGEDSEAAVFEDWKVQLDEICESFHGLEKSVKGRKARKRFKETLLDLEEVRDHVCREADIVGQMKNFLLNVQDDEDIEEDEREVAKWLTTSFMNGGEGNSWAAAAEGRASGIPLSPTISSVGRKSPSAGPRKPPGIFQRFDSARLVRSASSNSSIGLQRETTSEDDKTLDQNTDDSKSKHVQVPPSPSRSRNNNSIKMPGPYQQFVFYRTQVKVNKVLEGLGSWEFDIFEVEDMVGDLMLPLLGVTICKKLKSHDLNHFHDLPEKVVFDYLLAITNAYHPRSEVSYHNALHAADVMCSSYSLIKSDKFETFNYLQIVALIIAAAAHDVDHDGHNNTFHINSGSKLALKYNDRSVLENHHCSVGWKLAMHPKHNLVKAMPREQRNTFRNIFISSILATDMTGHGEQLKTLKDMHGKQVINTPKDQIKLLGHVLHSADISNVSKPFEYANTWVKLVMDEFFKQGDKEKDLNLPVSPLCDRAKTDIDASEVGFIKFVVKPWFESLSNVLPVRCSDALGYINVNFKTFKDRALRTQEQKNQNTSRHSLTRRSVLLSPAETSKAPSFSKRSPLQARSSARRAFTDDDIDFIPKRMSSVIRRAKTELDNSAIFDDKLPRLRMLPTMIHESLVDSDVVAQLTFRTRESFTFDESPEMDESPKANADPTPILIELADTSNQPIVQ